MKNAKGFTLVELIIVIIIVGILSIVAVPVYRGYTKKAMGTEAKALLGSVATAERVYYAEFDNFYELAATPFSTRLDVDARGNKYFTAYWVSVDDTGDNAAFTAITTGNGQSGAEKVSMTLISKSTGQPKLIESYGDGVGTIESGEGTGTGA